MSPSPLVLVFLVPAIFLGRQIGAVGIQRLQQAHQGPVHHLGEIRILYVNPLDLAQHLDEDAERRVAFAAAVSPQQTSPTTE